MLVSLLLSRTSVRARVLLVRVVCYHGLSPGLLDFSVRWGLLGTRAATFRSKLRLMSLGAPDCLGFTLSDAQFCCMGLLRFFLGRWGRMPKFDCAAQVGLEFGIILPSTGLGSCATTPGYC